MTTKDADTRDRILRAAADLLAASGSESVSTRAVCAAAGVGAPALYHHFGDKQGLLDAVAALGFERYLADKRAQPRSGDPVEDLRRGWDLHVEFGRTHPAFYALMYGGARRPPIAGEAHEILLGLVGRVARAGLLRVPVETAAAMMHAAGVGVTLAVIADPDGAGELSERTREAVLAALTTGAAADGAGDGIAARAVALRAELAAGPPPALSAPEAALLAEWLDRLA
ncbi:TetR/AcrR family transcriptional regulator [Actinomadura macrotermitis]|uniref:HTH tetR-type domain-containing protein n=1 Tax=Actinomadura macrotermitis TaxID=2585200 RepID=A0A7K0C7W8_9ACTN|nr:hypothetical protein [Actinomadura macrotermitis]